MSMSHLIRLSSVIVTLVITIACHSARPGGAPASPSVSAADAAAIERARADSARRPYTEADVAFMTHMIAHHAQAIEMSRLAPGHGASQSLLTLAERIINAQRDEIALMQQWLRDRRQPVPDPLSSAMPMPMPNDPHAGHDMTSMPGMLTPAQMQQLDSARGPEFDRLFLSLMIQHHRGAVTMVRELFATPGAAQDQSVFKLASDVQVDQNTEIARMSQMLATLITAPPPE
jgi:uncharacterized protein (DUF305 family)